MSKHFILSIDQGTTSSRAILFDHSGNITSLAQKEFTQYFPADAWVEHDPNEIWDSQKSVIEEVLKDHQKEVAAIGITNQRETTVVWDKETGKPIYNAIVWQDRRTSDYCDHLKQEGVGPTIAEKTGLVIDSYFSGTKIRWILNNVEGARGKATQGKLAFGTIDSWLIWKLTEGKVHVTDVSNASRTMLYNIRKLKWDTELLHLMDIPKSMLPEVKSSSEVYGESIYGIPISGIAGDQQAAMFGQMCLQQGMLKNTYGTGSFIMFNTGDEAVTSHNNLLTTIGYGLNGTTTYALEGSIFIAGAVVQWLRDGLGIITSSSDVEALANSVPDNGGVYLVPAFAGLGAPHWDQRARGSMFGLTRACTAAHIARAALESIAYQVKDVLSAMEADSGISINELRVDGGATVNDSLMQFQSDILQIPLVRPKILETTALGAAYLAGLATRFWKGTEELHQQWQLDKRFEPTMSAEKAAEYLHNWNKAVQKSKYWDE